MKKILFLTPFVPSNRAGGENFTRLLLEKLSMDCKIDLVYFLYGDDPMYKVPNENVRVVNLVDNSTFVKVKHALMHPTVHPMFCIRFSWRLLRFLEKLVAEKHYDILYLDHSQMFLYGKYFPNIKKILMSHDVMAQRYDRSGNWFSKKLILRTEGRLMKMPNSTVLTFSEKDCDIVKKSYGVEAKAITFFLDETTEKAFPQKIEKRLVFFGKWNRTDNFDGLKWFFENVYSRLDSKIKFSIVGKWLSKEFKVSIDNLPNVEYLGFVENPYAMIANSLATVSPLFSGAGVKVKVVESLACGTPVIGSEISFEGISSIYSKFMFKANSADDYIKIIENLSVDLHERRNFKEMFLNNYQKMSIVDIVKNL